MDAKSNWDYGWIYHFDPRDLVFFIHFLIHKVVSPFCELGSDWICWYRSLIPSSTLTDFRNSRSPMPYSKNTYCPCSLRWNTSTIGCSTCTKTYSCKVSKLRYCENLNPRSKASVDGEITSIIKQGKLTNWASWRSRSSQVTNVSSV